MKWGVFSVPRVCVRMQTRAVVRTDLQTIVSLESRLHFHGPVTNESLKRILSFPSPSSSVIFKYDELCA